MSHRDNSRILAACKLPKPFVTEKGIRVKITELIDHPDPNKNILTVKLRATKNGKLLFPEDEEFIFVNPPVAVPDGTTRTFSHHRHGDIQVPNHRVDPDAALKEFVADTIHTVLEQRG